MGDPVTPALVDLARALVALPGWRWRAGMLDTQGARVRDCGLFDLPDDWDPAEYARLGHQRLPDLTDDATGGVLLTAVFRLQPDATLGFDAFAGQLVLGGVLRPVAVLRPGTPTTRGTTLAEAAARALVALGRCA